MSSAANPQAYGAPGGSQGTGGSPWGPGPNWGAPPWQTCWHWGPPWAGHFLPRPVAIAVTVLGFIFWWPVGLALLFYMLGSGYMGCRSYRRGRNDGGPWQGRAWGDGPWAGWRSWCAPQRQAAPSTNGTTSGNRAFDEYRAETLRRLEEEQKEFTSFLERLRFAKDKAEFDQFMADRRQPPAPPAAPEGTEFPAA